MRILASTLQRALHVALTGELCPALPTAEETAFKEALKGLADGLPLEIDYSYYYDQSNSLCAMKGHPICCACLNCNTERARN